MACGGQAKTQIPNEETRPDKTLASIREIMFKMR